MHTESRFLQKQHLERVILEEATKVADAMRESRRETHDDLFSTLVIHVSIAHAELVPAILENFGGFGGLEERVRRQAQLLLNGTSDFGVAA